MPTHKKGHDKDKYYHLAKDQGYRSRAAFKLIQINKRFDFLAKARVCVDLCAAPGGWCQVAAKYMPTGSIVLGVDLLPIRAIRNVKTLVSDITTAECRRLVSSELNGWKADVVLCDGAPNIGAAYDKDAYVQNELVLAALKTATDHLAEGGTFCTKVYRSKDYNSLIWVFQQLFEDVQAIKPNSSRSQSSEIFIVCLKYTNPNRIDPKLLDPNHVFKEVSDPGLKTVDVLHKKYDKLNKRHRTGYEDGVGVLLRSFTSVSDFVKCKEPVRMLTDVNEFRFTDDCEEFRTSKFTTCEVKECFKDLRVLGKIDFKKLLKWRQQMRTLAGLDGASKTSADDDEEAVGKESKRAKKEETDESIQEEIMKLRTNALQQEKRDKKKSRLVASKERQRQALGMTNNAFGEANDMELFMIPSTSTHSQVDSIRDVDLDLEERDPTDFIDDEDEEWTGGRGSTSRVGPRGLIVKEEDELEDELESAYLRYVSGRKKSAKEREADSRGVVAGDDVQNPVTAKRARLSKSANSILSNQNEEDASTMKSRDKSAAVHGDLQAYVKMLSGSGGKKEGEGGSDDSDSDDDEFEDEEDDEEEEGDSDEYGNQDEDEDDDDDGAQVQTGGKRKLVSTDRAPKQSRIDQWFSHPVFQESVVNSDRGAKSKNSRSGERLSEQVMSAMAEIPKSDREIRKEKRKKEQERQERRGARKVAKSDTEVGILDLQIVPRKSTGNDEDDDDDVVLDEETRQKRELIKKGMGKSSASSGRQGDDSFEIAPAVDDRYPSRVDGRSYDSDDEDYDNHDRATTLALGTLMLRKSRQKALVDASYNRFAWNDPRDLPSWFLDDEMRHNKPQLPIPAALIEKIKSNFQAAGTKEIKKVAEARARKRKRAVAKLRSAKKQANQMAENSEMSEKQKIKAISKAMKSAKLTKSDKVYVVTRKTSAGSSGTKGAGNGKLKFVDARMKKEARAKRRREKSGGKRKK